MLIGLDTYETLLREVVALVNARPFGALLAMLPIRRQADESLDPVGLWPPALDLDEAATTLVATSPEPVEVALPGASLAIREDRSCDAGGTVVVWRAPPGIGRVDFDRCRLEAGELDGRYVYNGVGRDGSFFSVNALSIASADGGLRELSGALSRSFTRYGAAGALSWSAVDYEATDAAGTTRVSDYTNELVSTSPGAVGQLALPVRLPDGREATIIALRSINALEGQFNVVAPWTAGQTLTVEVAFTQSSSYWRWERADPGVAVGDVDLQVLSDGVPVGPPRRYEDTPLDVFNWNEGILSIVAEDGSRLVVTAASDEPAFFDITLDGIDGATRREWADGFEIECEQRLRSNCLAD